jgi:hypothetical protein
MTRYRVLEDLALGEFYPQRKRSWYSRWEYCKMLDPMSDGRSVHLYSTIEGAFAYIDRCVKPNFKIHEYPPK